MKNEVVSMIDRQKHEHLKSRLLEVLDRNERLSRANEILRDAVKSVEQQRKDAEAGFIAMENCYRASLTERVTDIHKLQDELYRRHKVIAWGRDRLRKRALIIEDLRKFNSELQNYIDELLADLGNSPKK